MATGIEEVVAVRALETGIVPPVANFKEIDPELGSLNLSKGGAYPVEYALRLAAGFGSQICLTLMRWVKTRDESRSRPNALGYATRIADVATWNAWLERMAGSPAAELEVVQRTLRVRDKGMSARAAAAEAVQLPQAVGAPLPVPAPKPVVAAKPAPVIAFKAAAAAAAGATTAVAAPPPPAPPKPAVESDPVKERILALVVEKTGYPKDMLDMDLDLEADLGVDTVKQAELFVAIREAYNIERDPNLKLRDFPTLTHVVGFVYGKRPDLAAAKAAPQASATSVAATSPVAAPAAAAATPVAPIADPVQERILELVVEKTGYPKDMLDLELDLEADLGVDTVKQAELFVAIREVYGIERDPNLKLRDFPTLKHVIGFVYSKRPELAEAKAKAEAAAASCSGSVGCPGSDSDGGRCNCRSCRPGAGAHSGLGRGEDRLSEGHAGPGA